MLIYSIYLIPHACDMLHGDYDNYYNYALLKNILYIAN